jgi:ribosome-associated protein
LKTGRTPAGLETHASTEPSEDQLLKVVTEAAWGKKARDILAMDVRKHTLYSDFILICSGTSDRHVRAIHQGIQDATREAQLPSPSVEGEDHNRWVLMDYGHLVVHVFFEQIRDVYELERLWADAPRIPLELREDPSESDGWE